MGRHENVWTEGFPRDIEGGVLVWKIWETEQCTEFRALKKKEFRAFSFDGGQ